MITLKQIDHYWYYYKWHFFACLFAIVAIVYTLYSCASVVHPDLSVTYVGTKLLNVENMIAFEQEYSKYIDDSNGDKKLMLKMDKIEFAPQVEGAVKDTQAEMAAGQKLYAEIIAGESNLFIFSADMLGYFQEQEIFEPLSSIGITSDHINLDGKPVLKVLNLFGNDYAAAIRIKPVRQNNKQKIQWENAVKVLNVIK